MERAELCRPPGLPGVEAFHGDFEHHRYPRHFHDEWLLVVIERGASQFQLGRDERVAGPSDVVVIPPGVGHTGGPAGDDGYAYRALYVAPGALAAAVDGSVAAPPRRPGWVLRSPRLAGLLRAAHRAAHVPEPGLAVDEAMTAALGAVATLAADGPPARPVAEPRAVRAAREAIDADPAADVRLRDLAAAAGSGEYRLIRAFVSTHGMPPHAYRQARRVALARGLIRDGMPLAEVAIVCGFCDQAHLTRVFRAVTGLTPGRAR